MPDPFSSYADNAAAPARHAVAVTPSDTIDLLDTPKGLYIGTGGDVTLVAADAPAGNTGTVFRGLPSGALLPVRVRRVLASGTTAADLVALF